MFPDQDYAPPRGSFMHPVPPPTTDPDASPTKTVSINCEWLPYIRGALQQLVLQATWVSADADLTLTQMRAMTLISMFDECSASNPPYICSGDVRDDPQPFGLWSIYSGCALGVYVPLAGYQTTVGPCGSSHYAGIEVDVQLDQSVQIDDVIITYDMSKGSWDVNDYALGVYDLANSEFAGTPLHSDDLVDGTALVYHTGPFAHHSDHYLIFIRSAGHTGSIDPPSPGLAYLLIATQKGHSPTYDCG